MVVNAEQGAHHLRFREQEHLQQRRVDNLPQILGILVLWFITLRSFGSVLALKIGR